MGKDNCGQCDGTHNLETGCYECADALDRDMIEAIKEGLVTCENCRDEDARHYVRCDDRLVGGVIRLALCNECLAQAQNAKNTPGKKSLTTLVLA